MSQQSFGSRRMIEPRSASEHESSRRDLDKSFLIEPEDERSRSLLESSHRSMAIKKQFEESGGQHVSDWRQD